MGVVPQENRLGDEPIRKCRGLGARISFDKICAILVGAVVKDYHGGLYVASGAVRTPDKHAEHAEDLLLARCSVEDLS